MRATPREQQAAAQGLDPHAGRRHGAIDDADLGPGQVGEHQADPMRQERLDGNQRLALAGIVQSALQHGAVDGEGDDLDGGDYLARRGDVARFEAGSDHRSKACRLQGRDVVGGQAPPFLAAGPSRRTEWARISPAAWSTGTRRRSWPLVPAAAPRPDQFGNLSIGEAHHGSLRNGGAATALFSNRRVERQRSSCGAAPVWMLLSRLRIRCRTRG